ncbi:TPA: hypothetical protein R4229_001734 [Morganella morganii]|nr:hypothetical protein [Morganella morganii]
MKKDDQQKPREALDESLFFSEIEQEIEEKKQRMAEKVKRFERIRCNGARLTKHRFTL